jgi:hypothetical protein
MDTFYNYNNIWMNSCQNEKCFRENSGVNQNTNFMPNNLSSQIVPFVI